MLNEKFRKQIAELRELLRPLNEAHEFLERLANVSKYNDDEDVREAAKTVFDALKAGHKYDETLKDITLKAIALGHDELDADMVEDWFVLSALLLDVRKLEL